MDAVEIANAEKAVVLAVKRCPSIPKACSFFSLSLHLPKLVVPGKDCNVSE